MNRFSLIIAITALGLLSSFAGPVGGTAKGGLRGLAQEKGSVTGDEVIIFKGPGKLAGTTFKVVRSRDKEGVGHATAFLFPPNDPKGNFEKLLDRAAKEKKRVTVLSHPDKNGNAIIEGVVIK